MTAVSTTPIEIIRGDDEAIAITVKDDNDVSLIKNGAEFFLTVKKNVEDTDDEAVYKNNYPVSADADSFTIDLSNTETELELGSYLADIQWKDENGKIKTIYRGNLSVLYDITRRTD